MDNTMALLLSDTYKQCHDRMYPKGLTKLVSYWVPRKSMLENQNEMVFFGLQAFIKEYLMGYFQKNFFDLSEDEMLTLYTDSMDVQIGRDNYDLDKIVELHRLGYLPLEIRALPEGTLVPMGVPCIEITNTDDKFAWLVQWIECILQVELWKPCCHATIGHMYREIADYWYNKTTDGLPGNMACADFGMRGMSCMDEATRCSASWLLSFNKTSTIPAINYIDRYYNADCKNNGIGIGAVSTEHSVMGANFSIDGDEITFVKRLLTELYPNTSFSMVSDTYDYWNMVNNILPQCKEEIMNHNGKLLVRPDSGDIVEISVKTVERLWEIFDEEMGSGTGHGAGEECKFLFTCLRKGLRLTFIPKTIATLQEGSESQWFSGYDRKYFFWHGWAIKRILGTPLAMAYALYTAVTKYRVYNENLSAISATKQMFKGIFYKNNK